MKVYIVLRGDYEDSEVEGVYRKREDALAHARRFVGCDGNSVLGIPERVVATDDGARTEDLSQHGCWCAKSPWWTVEEHEVVE